jgi:hypothetical protein
MRPAVIAQLDPFPDDGFQFVEEEERLCLHVQATLRAALNAAVRAEEIPRNVAIFADLPVGGRPKVRPWEPEQLGAWLDSITGERLYPCTTSARLVGCDVVSGMGWAGPMWT